MSAFGRTERRQSVAERRPSVPYVPEVIPHLAGLEKPQSHSLNMDQCDVLIMGTGLVESILAAALAWQGVEILHIDSGRYYGDLTSTLTIKQLKEWCVSVNQGRVRHFEDAQLYIPGNEGNEHFNSKDYGIDLTPKILFARSDLLSLLVKSRTYKYLEFQSLSNFHVFENDCFNKQISNTTKEDIFTDQSLSLVTKRHLMKFLKFVLQDNSDPAKKQVLRDNKDVPIDQFLKNHFNLELPQINELVYSIGLCNKEDTPSPAGIARIKRFLTSFDVYGSFPVMLLKYGGPGEISQAFCRSAAVAGTTYKLNTSLTDYDPQTKVARFSDGSSVKINEKLIISPTQIPRFLQKSYQEISEDLPLYSVRRLVAIVKKDCKEWMSENETSAIVVFPPNSLPTGNKLTVQVIIQNGGSGVCPEGQAIWYFQTVESGGGKAKQDLDSAFEKMEASILRESSADIDDVLDENDFTLSAKGTPVVINSFKLGESLQNFVPKEKLEIVCKLGYVQKTFVNPDLSNIVSANEKNNVALRTLYDSENIIFSNMPSSEISYDGIVGDCKLIYSRVTGSDEDFFDVDFEDEEDNYNEQHEITSDVVSDEVSSNVVSRGSMDDIEEANHQPFGAEEMEL